MLNANLSYEENLRHGPATELLPGASLPRLRFPEEPKFSFLGIPLHVPFGIPAGPLLSAEYVQAALDAGFCLPFYKTVRTRSWPAHPWPNLLLVSDGEQVSPGKTFVARPLESADYGARCLTLCNSFGVPSQSPDVWREDFCSLSWTRGFAPVLSFQGSRSLAGHGSFVADTLMAARMAGECAWEAGARVVELNLSAPNDGGVPVFRERDKAVALVLDVARTLAAVSPALKLVIKIGILPETETFELVRGTAGFVHAISAINAIPGRVVGPSREPVWGCGEEWGGLCGALILERGLEMVRRLRSARRRLGMGSDSLAIIGMGGVASAQDFLKYREAGADVVLAATGAIWNPGLAREVAESLGVRSALEVEGP